MHLSNVLLFISCYLVSTVESFASGGSDYLRQRIRRSYSSTTACDMSKPRILCLHGKAQTGESFSKKIGGARRKLERAFDLTFLDGPIDLEDTANQSVANNGLPIMNTGRAWFLREPLCDGSENGEPLYRYTQLHESIEYVVQYAKKNGPYDGLMGFSQGGTLATALATSGCISVRAVLTAGAPCVDEAFDATLKWAKSNQRDNGDNHDTEVGLQIPKLHLAGQNDAMIPVESVTRLAERGGHGEIVIHEKGHLFPTRAVHVDKMVEFLKSSLEEQ